MYVIQALGWYFSHFTQKTRTKTKKQTFTFDGFSLVSRAHTDRIHLFSHTKKIRKFIQQTHIYLHKQHLARNKMMMTMTMMMVTMHHHRLWLCLLSYPTIVSLFSISRSLVSLEFVAAIITLYIHIL